MKNFLQFIMAIGLLVVFVDCLMEIYATNLTQNQTFAWWTAASLTLVGLVWLGQGLLDPEDNNNGF